MLVPVTDNTFTINNYYQMHIHNTHISLLIQEYNKQDHMQGQKAQGKIEGTILIST